MLTNIMKFGEFLRNERTLRAMTLEEISAHTKVNTRFLEAIENDDLSVLPAKAFAKGFLRSYARMVGLDEDLVLTNFEYYHQGIPSGGTSAVNIKPPARTHQQHLLFWVLLVMMILLTGVIFFYYQGHFPLR